METARHLAVAARTHQPQLNAGFDGPSPSLAGAATGRPRSNGSNCSFAPLARPLSALSDGDKESNSWPVSSTGSHPALSGSDGPLELLRVQEFEWYARPVTLRNPALI